MLVEYFRTIIHYIILWIRLLYIYSIFSQITKNKRRFVRVYTTRQQRRKSDPKQSMLFFFPTTTNSTSTTNPVVPRLLSLLFICCFFVSAANTSISFDNKFYRDRQWLISNEKDLYNENNSDALLERHVRGTGYFVYRKGEYLIFVPDRRHLITKTLRPYIGRRRQ